MPTVQRHGDLRPAHLVTRRPQLHSRETVLHVILSDRAVRGGFRPQPLVFRDPHVGRQMLEWDGVRPVSVGERGPRGTGTGYSALRDAFCTVASASRRSFVTSNRYATTCGGVNRSSRL